MSATLGSSTAAMVGRAPARHRQARAAKIPSPPLGTSGIVGLRPPSSTTSITSYRRPLGPPSASANVATDMTLSDERKKELAREFIETGSGYFTPPREELFADDFVFRGPIIGPFTKKDYLKVLNTFKLYDAFSDLRSNSWGYSVDPIEPNRVWFFIRQTGVNSGKLFLNSSFSIPPSGRKVFGAPEVNSLLLTDEGKVRLLTVGYVCDYDAPKSNVNKLGAAFGLLAGSGLPVPTAIGKALRPYQKVLRFLSSSGVDVPIGNSEWDEVPQWYKDYVPERREGSEGAPGY